MKTKIRYLMQCTSAAGTLYTYFRFRDQRLVGLPNPDDSGFSAAYKAALKEAKRLELAGLAVAPLRIKSRQRDIVDTIKAVTNAGKTVTGVVIDNARGTTTITFAEGAQPEPEPDGGRAWRERREA